MPIRLSDIQETETKPIRLSDISETTKPMRLSDIDKPSPVISPKTGFMQEAFVQPAKTFYGGTLKSAANFADTLDFYSDKIANVLGVPETKDSVFEYLRDNWGQYGNKLQKEGVSNKLIKSIYSGLGEAGFEIPKLMTMGPQGLAISGALEGGKTGGFKGVVTGAAKGALFKNILRGTGTLPRGYAEAAGATAFGGPSVVEELRKPPQEREWEKPISEAVVGGVLTSFGKKPTRGEFKKTQLKYSPLVKGVRKVMPYEARERVYQNYINRMQSIENVVNKAKKLGADILPGENPALRARNYLGLGQKVKTVLENKTYRITPQGRIEITGEGLKPILDNYDKRSPIKNRNIREKDLTDYLLARRTVADLQRPKNERTTEQIVTPQQVKQAQTTLNNINQKYGKGISHLEQTAQRLYAYQKRVLGTLVDSGSLSKQQYDLILAKNPHYVPFDRIVSEVDSAGVSTGKIKFTGARSPIKRIKGSQLEIHNPIESMIKNTYRIMDIAERNTIARSMAKLGQVLPEDISPVKSRMQPIKVTEKEAGEAKTLFRPSQFKPKGNVIEYFDNGKRSYIEVTPNVYQAMSGLNETSLGIMTKILAVPAQTLRVGATITPEFMLRNPVRDQWTALLQTKVGFKPFVDTTGAIADILGKTQAYNDWLRSGGAYSGFVELSRPKVRIALKELQNKPSLLRKLNIISKAQDISQLFEQATRLGVYKAGVKKGLSPVEAGFESRESTIDFARRGSQTKDINTTIAFFNAGVQGTDKALRTAIEDPMGFAVKATATITIPSLLLHLKNRKDPDFKEIPRWQRDLFWITKIGETYVRIPKPFLYGQIYGSIAERFFEYLDTEDPSAFDKLEKSIYDSIAPVSGDPAAGILATGIKPLVENATNWNFFLGRKVVPVSREGLLPEEQYGKYTTETAKVLGKILKQSPAKIENLAKGWFGGTGKYVLEGGDVLIRGIRKATKQKVKPRRPRELADIPLIKGFVTRPIGAQSESVQKFYETTRDINAQYSTYTKLMNEGETKKAEAISKRYPEWAHSKTLDTFAGLLSSFTDQIDSIVKSPKYSEEEKRKRISDLEKKRIDIARKANALIADARKKSK